MTQTEKPDTPQKQRRFMLFGGMDYYPGGGVHDLLSSHETIDEARRHAADLVSYGYVPPKPQILGDGRISTAHALGWPIEWWHVFDSDSGEVVAARFEE
jgi:hypothetical protein